jgi:hypothetical protein
MTRRSPVAPQTDRGPTQGPGRNLDLGFTGTRVGERLPRSCEGAHRKNRRKPDSISEGDEADPQHTPLRKRTERRKPPLNHAHTQIDFGDVSSEP